MASQLTPAQQEQRDELLGEIRGHQKSFKILLLILRIFRFLFRT